MGLSSSSPNFSNLKVERFNTKSCIGVRKVGRKPENNSLKLELVRFERRILNDNPTKEVCEGDRQTGPIVVMPYEYE